MKVQPIFAPNETEEALARAYRHAVARLPGADDEQLAALRERSITRFEASGLPHRRMESWKYTDLRRLLQKLPEESGSGALPDFAATPLYHALAPLDPHWLVFVDGRFAPALSGGRALPDGVEVRALSQGIAGWAAQEIAATGAGQLDSVFDLNTALMADGALVRVAAGVEAGVPIAIVHIGQCAGTRHLRHVILLEEGASLVLAEAYCGGAEGDDLTTAAVSLRVGDGAALDHVKLQQAGPAATHLAPHVAEIGARARVSSFTLTQGAALAREERHVRLAGADSDVSVSGAYFLDGRQHGDTRLVVTHAAPGCISRERYKGLVGGAARGVFQGCIVVERGAQKTDAKQSIDALLLSDEARHDAKPELEIYADDVQCGHGATTGELDRQALFYLRSRGIARDEAERLLIQAFVHDGLTAIAHDGLRQALTVLADARLAERNIGGGDA